MKNKILHRLRLDALLISSLFFNGCYTESKNRENEIWTNAASKLKELRQKGIYGDSKKSESNVEVCTRNLVNHPEVNEPLASGYSVYNREFNSTQNNLILATYSPGTNNTIFTEHKNRKRPAYQCQTCHKDSDSTDKLYRFKHNKNLTGKITGCMPCHTQRIIEEQQKSKAEQIQEILNSMNDYNA